MLRYKTKTRPGLVAL